MDHFLVAPQRILIGKHRDRRKTGRQKPRHPRRATLSNLFPEDGVINGVAIEECNLSGMNLLKLALRSQ